VIAIVDVCSGNLRSVERALAQVGGDVQITQDPAVVRRADKVVVPGQGAFGVFMRGLAERRLDAPLREAIADGRPYLGICLGLQILFDESDEQGPCAGLGVLRGRVTRLAPSDPRLKVPHMGWNRVTGQRDPLLAGIDDGAYVYFVHSFRVEPAEPITVLEADHGVRFCAAIRKANLFACQFHPEKSQAIGLQLLRNFVHGAT